MDKAEDRDSEGSGGDSRGWLVLFLALCGDYMGEFTL